MLNAADAAKIVVETLISEDAVSVMALIYEAEEKYAPMFRSVGVELEDGSTVPLVAIYPNIVERRNKIVPGIIHATRLALKREDRVIWALQFFKKAMIYEVLWYAQNEPQRFAKKFGSPAKPEQPAMVQQLQRMSGIDLSPFEMANPEDPTLDEPPYSAISIIDAINERIGNFILQSEKYGPDFQREFRGDLTVDEIRAATSEYKRHPYKSTERSKAIKKAHIMSRSVINSLRFTNQSYTEIISLFRRCELEILKTRATVIKIEPVKDVPYDMQDEEGPIKTVKDLPYDMQDEEGPIKTVIDFGDGFRWFDLMRTCSPMRDDVLHVNPPRPPGLRRTGHCANTGQNQHTTKTCFELAQQVAPNAWKHHAFVVLHNNGEMGEAKGRNNQKPPPELTKYFFELLRQEKRIKNVQDTTSGNWAPSHDFHLSDLNPQQTAILLRERPKLFRK
jgi:hypothetical protein